MKFEDCRYCPFLLGTALNEYEYWFCRKKKQNIEDVKNCEMEKYI